MKRSLLPSLCLAAAACAPSAPPAAPAPMLLQPAAAGEYSAYLTPGSATLSGQAFLTTRGGDVKKAAGRQVTLDPATPYAIRWYSKYGRALDRFSELPLDSTFARARRTAVADAEGRFRFSGLPAGSYIARSTVTWETGAAYGGLQGGIVSDVFDIDAGATKEAILSTSSGGQGARIMSLQDIGGRPFTRLREVKGESCNMNGGQPSSEEAARADLSFKAAAANADAVINVVCKKGGLSFSKNCVAFWECVGEAVLLT